MRLSVAALLAVTLTLAAPASSGTGLHRDGAVAFVSDRNAVEIYESNPDGSGAVQLTAGVDARWPALSPDGTKLAYAAKRGGNWELFIKPLAGGETVDVSNDPGFDGYPDWSPDGSKLAYAGEDATGFVQIMIHDFATNATTNLTQGALDQREAWHPRWSPDGLWIAFTCQGNGIDVCMMKTDGSKGVDMVTTDQGWELDPTWSPDGNAIAFVAYPYSIADIFVIPFTQGTPDGTKIRDITNTPTVSEIQPDWSAAGIAFRADRGGFDQVYSMRPDGSALRRVSPRGAFEGDPRWSRDATKLVFMSGRRARFDISELTPAGRLKTLTHSPGSDGDPAWSSDGRRIAFARAPGAARSDIYVMNAARRGLRNLTRGRGYNWSPAWSPDGTHIAFVRFESFGAQIWEMNADGSHQRALTSVGAWNVHPSWSPDGTRLVFSAVRKGAPSEGLSSLWVIDLRTHRERRLTSNKVYAEWPSWSPDGSLIAFDSIDHVWLVRTNGTGLRQLTRDPIDTSREATWAPDGRQILFVRDHFFGHDTNLYAIARDGSGEHPVGSLDVLQSAPSWQPLR